MRASRAAADDAEALAGAADCVPPFEFFAALLDRGRHARRMLARLGPEAADAIDEFLNLALAYDDGAPPSLQGFLGWLREGTREIKRDMEQGRNEVRVMTVHGAKGLEAPIVFLPDTCSTRSGGRRAAARARRRARPPALPAPFLWPVKGTSRLAAVQPAKAASPAREAEERNRLLYVALTRARDRLYVAGFEGSKAPPRRTAGTISSADGWRPTPGGDGRGRQRRVAHRQRPDRQARGRQGARIGVGRWHAAARLGEGPAPPEPLITVPLAPSRLAPLETERRASPRAAARPARRAAVLSPSALADDAASCAAR